MNKINIAFMSDEAVETLRANPSLVTKGLKENPENSDWLKEIYSGKLYDEKKYKVSEIQLLTSENGNYEEVDFENSIRIYEGLKDLPRYILTDERFWCWFNFTIGYKASLQAIPIRDKDSTFLNMWLFTQGKRRGLFFNVMARCFLRVALTVDERLEDKYELTKFVIENPLRFRELTWRSNSNEKHLVLGILKAEKKIFEEYGERMKNSNYPEIAKYISLYGSVRLIDAVTEEDVYKITYDKLKEMIDQAV
jgi:hypothetical protein